MSTRDATSTLSDVFSLRPDRTTAVVVTMLVLDAVFWSLLLRGEVPMPGMMWLMKNNIPMAAPGAVERAVFHLGTPMALGKYVVMWGVMMWAMMYPAMIRFTRDFADALRGPTVLVAGTVAAFLLGYSTMWMLSAAIPLTFEALLPGGIYGFTKAHTVLAIGGVLLLTGIYQLTNFKQSMLRTCCARVPTRDADVVSGLIEGLKHGITCILVSFGFFFLVMPFFGEMNTFWMLALTFPITIERLPASWGREVSVGLGAVTLLAGLIVLFLQPSIPLAF